MTKAGPSRTTRAERCTKMRINVPSVAWLQRDSKVPTPLLADCLCWLSMQTHVGAHVGLRAYSTLEGRLNPY